MLGNAEKLFFQLCRKQWVLWGTRGGSLLIITAECTAQTTTLHSHHEGYNTSNLILIIFAASMVTYSVFRLHGVYRRSTTDLEHNISFVYNLKTLVKCNKICHCALPLIVCIVCFTSGFYRLCLCLSQLIK